MERYSFFDAQQTESGYDRVYSSADMARYFASFIGNGVYAEPANQLMVQPSSGLTVKVKQGKAWIDGYFYELYEADKELTLGTSDSVYPRIDRIVVRLDLQNRTMSALVVPGTPAQQPVAPALTRDTTYYDLCLAEITVKSGATAITDGDIKDTRPDNTVCGWVYQVVDKIDTTDLFKQYDAKFDASYGDWEKSFTSWFDTVKGLMDGDTGTKLASEVATLQTSKADAKHTHSASDITSGTLPVDRGGTGISANPSMVVDLESAGSAEVFQASPRPGVTGALGIANGGTGATSASDARTSLGITLANIGVTIGTSQAPDTGTPGTLYIQML